MNLINKLKRKYISIKHKYRKFYEVYAGDDNLMKVLQDEIRVINKAEPLGTATWEKNRREIRRAILEDDISDFINWSVIQKTMFYEAPEVEYKEVMRNVLLSKSVKESKVGNPKPYYLDLFTSGNLIHHAYSISKLFDKCEINDFQRIVEFGGGYGSMCRLFRNMNFLGQYAIFDLPEFLALQKFYLSSIKSIAIDNVIFAKDTNKLSGNNDLSTLFIATWSLSEMPIELRGEILNNLMFDYCVIAFQSEFDGINNIDYFNEFKDRYSHIQFDIFPIRHLKGHFMLIGSKKK